MALDNLHVALNKDNGKTFLPFVVGFLCVSLGPEPVCRRGWAQQLTASLAMAGQGFTCSFSSFVGKLFAKLSAEVLAH